MSVFDAFKTEGNSPHYVFRARGRVYAHMRACADKQEEACTHKGNCGCAQKKQVDEPVPDEEETTETR